MRRWSIGRLLETRPKAMVVVLLLALAKKVAGSKTGEMWYK